MRQVILLILFFFVSVGVQAQAEHRGQTVVRMMSYNVHNGVGEDGKRDYGRIAGVINRFAPDVVALQELDSATSRSNRMDILQVLAEETRMYQTYAPVIDYQGGKYGIGILSREKPLSVRRMSLPGREERRVFLLAEFGKYVFCCTHFSLTEADRLASVPIIWKALENIGKPVFIAGDLNAHPDSPVVKALKEKAMLVTDGKGLTFPAGKPEECLDYILGYQAKEQGYAVLKNGVMNEALASDHRPVYAEVCLKTNPEQLFRTRPYLQNPTGNGITVSWMTHVPVYSWVEYGLDRENTGKVHTIVDGQVIANNYIHKIRLEHLQPGQTYYYRVCSKEILSYRAYQKVFGETVRSDWQSFTISDPMNTDFTALIFNDVHKHYRTMDSLYDRVKEVGYDFVLFNGDCIDDPANEAEAVQALSYFNDKVGAARVPVFYLRGNHEIRNAYSIQLRELFDYVGNKTYGAFNWGDTRFVMLDCGEDKPDDTWVYYGLNDFARFRLEQVDFIKSELASKDFKKASKRVLIHHAPVFGNTDEYQPCLELWGKWLEKAPFAVAVSAHTHEYKYHPVGSLQCCFPVVVGGGYALDTATVMVLSKKGKNMTLSVLNSQGKILNELKL